MIPIVRLRQRLILCAVLLATAGAFAAWKFWAMKAPPRPGPFTYTRLLMRHPEEKHPAILRVGLDWEAVGPRSKRTFVIFVFWLAAVLALDQILSRLELPVKDDLPEIALREVSDADVELFFAHQREPEANRMAAFPARGREAFFKHWEKIRKDPSVVIRTIESYGRVVGNVAAFTRGDLREVCYWLGREHWGKGIASEALGKFLEEVKERPLYARIAKTNAGSLRVAGKNGFRIIGEEAFKDPSGDTVEEYLLKL